MAILISKWTSFIAKNISKDKGCHNDKEVGSSRGQTVLNICTLNNRILKIHEIRTDGFPRRNSQILSFSWRFQYSSLSIENYKSIVDLNNTVNRFDLPN